MAEITNPESTPVNSRNNGLEVHNSIRISIPTWLTINTYNFGITSKKLILHNLAGSGTDIRFWIGVTPSTGNYHTLKEGERVEIDARVTSLYSCGATANTYVEVIVLK